VLRHLSSGLTLATASASLAGAVEAVTHELLSYGTGASAFFAARDDDPDCASASAICAALHLFTMTRAGFRRAAPYLAAARHARNGASERERQFVDATLAWAAEDYRGAIAGHREIARCWPEDLLSAKIGQFHQLNCGDFSGMLELVEDILPAHHGTRFVHGMHAFALEQCGRATEAEAQGRLACSLGFDPWAQHAVAHVLDSAGRAVAGREWLSAHAAGWDTCSSFLYTHNWWHLALFHLELDDADAALALMDDHVWAKRRDYCQDQINAISLLARLELRGVDVGGRWHDIAAQFEQRTGDHVNGFLDLHYAYALARAGRDADVAGFVRSVADKASRSGGGWRDTMPGAVNGVVAHARGQHGVAAALLRKAGPGLRALGGSNTQRDLFELLYLDSLIGSRALSEAERLLLRRQDRRGAIGWQQRALAEIGARPARRAPLHAPSARAA
jgi:hypothetical protein